MTVDELNPEFFYLVLRDGCQEDHARLIQALVSRGVAVLRQRSASPGDGWPEGTLILKLAGNDPSNLMLELAQEGIGGDLAAYGPRVPGRAGK